MTKRSAAENASAARNRSSVTTAIVFRFLISLRFIDCIGREKFPDRERDIPEQAAWILSGTSAALFAGHAIVVDGYQELGIPLQAYNGKLPKCYIDTASIASAGELTVKITVYKTWNFRHITVTGMRITAIYELCIQYNGIYRLYNGDGEITLTHQLGVHVTCSEFR
jgi:hypothetical protein